MPGMIFTIEPMINAGKRDIKEDRKGNRPYDGWTIVTRDRSLSAQWEHTRARHRHRLRGADGVCRQPAAAGLRPRGLRHARRRHRCRAPPPRLPLPERMSALPEASARGPGSVAALRARFRDGKARADRRVPRRTAHRHRRRAAARRPWRATSTPRWPTLWQHAAMPAGAALVAVGGYGRGELFPLLRRRRAGAAARGARRRTRTRAASRFVTACWDIGVEPGSSVRTVDECLAEAARDVTVQTALLEARFVCGARRLFSELPARLRRGHGRRAPSCAPRRWK